MKYFKNSEILGEIVFEVPLMDGRVIYMSPRKTAALNEKRCVVIVDAKKFLDLWRIEPNSGHYEIANGNPETWRNDKKYPNAELGFSQGRNNPVPLAEVAFFKAGSINLCQNHVRFTDGVTRTIWLLANGCQEFPVECLLSGDAEGLYEAAGAVGTSLKTIVEIIEESR